MPLFPDEIYTPRETENLPGLVYDVNDKKNMFSEDFQNLGMEINAIENTLGTTPQGAFETVKEWLQWLTDNLITVFSFLQLTDTPDSYSGESHKLVRVNATEDGLEFVTPSNGMLGSRRQNGYVDITSADGYVDIAHGLSGQPKVVLVNVVFENGSAVTCESSGAIDSSNGMSCNGLVRDNSDANRFQHDSAVAQIFDNVALSANHVIVTASVDATNVRLSWVKTGSPTGGVWLYNIVAML